MGIEQGRDLEYEEQSERIEKLITSLGEVTGELTMIDVPDEVDDLYAPHVIVDDPDRYNTGDWLNDSDDSLDGAIGLFEPEKSRELDDIVDWFLNKIRDKAGSKAHKIPEVVLDIDNKRLGVKNLLIQMSQIINEVKPIIPDISAEYDHSRINYRIDDALRNIKLLFNNKRRINRLTRDLLEGRISADKFESEWNKLLPEVTWDWRY